MDFAATEDPSLTKPGEGKADTTEPDSRRDDDPIEAIEGDAGVELWTCCH